MKSTTVTVRYSGNGYTVRAGSGKTAKTVSCTHSPEVAAARAAAKFFGVQTDDNINVAGRFTHDEGGTYTATLPDEQGAVRALAVVPHGLGFLVGRPLTSAETLRYRLEPTDKRPMSALMVNDEGLALVTDKADAYAFAASHEMLAALEVALPELENYVNDCESYEAPEDVETLRKTCATVRAAITKAKGGA